MAGVGKGTFCNCKMRRFEYGPSWGRMEGSGPQRWKKTRELVRILPLPGYKNGRVAVEAENYYDFVSGSCVS